MWPGHPGGKEASYLSSLQIAGDFTKLLLIGPYPQESIPPLTRSFRHPFSDDTTAPALSCASACAFDIFCIFHLFPVSSTPAWLPPSIPPVLAIAWHQQHTRDGAGQRDADSRR